MAAKKHILVVEDEKSMARALELKLTSSGYDVTVAYDGSEALDALQKGTFDIALLDLIMPKVDGFEVLRQMKERGDKTPVIVSTNLSQSEDEKRAKELGAKDYFVKSDTPITEVIAYIKKVLK
jgi:DNA-binding response OmpR family regulator